MEFPNLLGQVIDGYKLEQKIGSGGFGVVYLGVKEDSKRYLTAIKHIIVPEPDKYEEILLQYNNDMTLADRHFEQMVENMTAEFNTLLDLSQKDNRHIVTYYDHTIRKTEKPLHCDVFIRMEYLTTLAKHMKKNGLSLCEIVKLGINICDALILCHENGVIHRDIKEANIFIGSNKAFKLGDFGVSKALIGATYARTMMGTFSYMAPEILSYKPYDETVDLYSLGIVLYRLLNYQRNPFLPEFPQEIKDNDTNMADERRIRGDMPPLPSNAKDELGEIVIHACAPKESRFSSAAVMKSELEKYYNRMSEVEKSRRIVTPVENYIEPTPDGFQPNSVPSGASVNPYEKDNEEYTKATLKKPQPAQESVPIPNAPPKKKGSKAKILVPICIVLVAALAIGGYFGIKKLTDPVAAFKTQFDAQNYTQAQDIVNNKIGSNSSELDATSKYLQNKAQSVVNDFAGKTLDYDTALAQLKAISNMKVVPTDAMSKFTDKLNGLQTSRSSYEAAQTDLSAKNYEKAIGELQKVINTDDNYSNAQQQLVTATKGYKDNILSQVSGYTDPQDYSKAVDLLTTALTVVPSDADLTSKLNDFNQKVAVAQQADIVNQIKAVQGQVAKDKDYTGALASLNTLLAQYPGNSDIQKAITTMQTDHANYIVAQASSLSAANKFDDAMKALNDGLALYPDNSTIKNAISDTQTKQKSYILAQADNLAKSGKYQDAIDMLKSSKYSNSAEIKDKITEYTSDLPVYLDTIDYLSFTSFYGNIYNWSDTSNGTNKDNIGNTYNHGIGLYLKTRTGYGGDNGLGWIKLEYFTNSSYKDIKGLFVLNEKSKNTSGVYQMEIYKDGALAYTSPELKTGTIPIDFDVDISGAQKILIYIKMLNYGPYLGGDDFGLVNTVLSK